VQANKKLLANSLGKKDITGTCLGGGGRKRRGGKSSISLLRRKENTASPITVKLQRRMMYGRRRGGKGGNSTPLEGGKSSKNPDHIEWQPHFEGKKRKRGHLLPHRKEE